jgi:hypothetical protein
MERSRESLLVKTTIAKGAPRENCLEKISKSEQNEFVH